MSPDTMSKPIRAGLAALAVLLAAGAFLINAYVQKERQRDLDDWSIRLGLVAETRVTALENWLDEQTASLGELANNASLQLYLWKLTQREDKDTDPAAIEPAQLSYLRNLLLAGATRYGFTPAQKQQGIPANLPQHQGTGLALLDAKQRLVVATTGMPETGNAFQSAIDTALVSGKPTFSKLVLDSHDRVLLGIAVPVPVVLGAQDNWAYAGVVFGVHSAEQTLYPLLTGGAPMTDSDDTLLVREEDNQVVYLSPTRGGGTPTRKSLPLENSDLAAAAAIKQPGAFGEFHNYQGRKVLATSRALRSVPWVLVQEVDAVQAMQESNRHRQFLVTAFSLLLFFVAATLVAAWRHGSSVRAMQNAAELRSKTLALQKQTELLHAVTDNAEAYVALLDKQQRVLFANARLATITGTREGELTGNSLAGVIGPANAQPLSDSIEQLQQDGAAHHCTRTMTIGNTERTLQCSLVPVAQVGERDNAILLVMQDITEFQRVQQKHAELLRKLVGALMHVVDLHDPHSANHSARMVEVANAIGNELKLGAEDSRTLDLAASLANLGKIFVPREILTKTEPLTEAEQALLQRHVRFGTELLADLDFDGPVLDTIEQKQEHLDGSGYPHGLRGDEILLTARILAVSNAFVALVSPRAYRDAVDIEQALNQLLQEAGSKYDRHVVAALFHIAENRSDWSEWQED
ncbi:MAG: HD domain-containing phosphohydrolase [Thiogranum sp.]